MSYKPKIKPDELVEIYADAAARIEMRTMWFDYAEWKLRNPIRLYRPKKVTAQNDGDDEAFLAILDQILAAFKIEESVLLKSSRSAAHPAKRLLVERCVDAGMKYAAIARNCNVSIGYVDKIVGIQKKKKIARALSGVDNSSSEAA